MFTNSSKRHQVVLDENPQNKIGTKKFKIDKAPQNNCSGKSGTSRNCEFFKFSKDNAQKCYKEKTLPNLDWSTDPGNDFY